MRNKHPVSGNTKKKSGRGNSPAAFLRGALLAAVAGLLACAVLTAVADPFFHYHAPFWGLAAAQTDKEYQVPGALRHFRYNAVLAGSSVVENNDNRWFDDAFSVHIRKCIDYIYENLGADLSVKTLAKAAELNPAYLSRLFRQEVGIPLTRFVKEARVDTAQNLLRYSDLSYLVISTSLGFSTQSVFIAVFKEITGMTPKVYRETYYTKNK